MLKMNENNKLFLSVSFIILYVLSISSYYFVFSDRNDLDKVMYLLTILLLIIGLRKGGLFSLGISLLVIFLIGSYFLFIQVTNPDSDTLSISNMIAWQISLIVGAYISGYFFRVKEFIISTYQNWAAKFDELVTIDPHTGFNNQKRFFFHLLEEFKRSGRYHQTFSLLLVRIKNWEEFKKLYGESEAIHMITNVSQGFRGVTRTSDGKFRLSSNTFALILPETPIKGAEMVIQKINQNVADQPLKGKERMVTLAFEYGLTSNNKEFEDYMEMYQHAKEELDRFIS
jgi:diguanylate cyclase (GGDEF)-like protein